MGVDPAYRNQHTDMNVGEVKLCCDCGKRGIFHRAKRCATCAYKAKVLQQEKTSAMATERARVRRDKEDSVALARATGLPIQRAFQCLPAVRDHFCRRSKR